MLSSAHMGSVRRTSWRQFLPFLILNVVVSGLTMVLVLTLWDRSPRPQAPTPTETLAAAAVAASAIPSPTATIRPSPTPHTYLVQPGDTMNEIAAQLGLTVEALMAANGLTDPDTLSAGQVLLVPELDDPVATGSTEIPPTATAPPPPSASPAVEIRSVSGAGDLDQEVVQLLNRGGAADMVGWTMDDGRGNRYVFPAFTLHSGAVSVHTRSGTDTVIDLYWGRPEAVWIPGTEVTLRDADGEIQSTFAIP